ncbi:MAG: AAA family ATPase [Bryobacteraceae bacterium]
MIVVAGPSGSGKSTVFRPEEAQLDYFNADERARDLNNGSGRNISPAIRAQVNQDLEQFIADHIWQRASFAYETTLRTKITCDQARLAKAHGFKTSMSYVALESAAESIRRVRLRAEKGGHSAPPERIREIYDASLGNLPQALREFDSVAVYDNTAIERGSPEGVLLTVDGTIVHLGEQPPNGSKRHCEEPNSKLRNPCGQRCWGAMPGSASMARPARKSAGATHAFKPPRLFVSTGLEKDPDRPPFSAGRSDRTATGPFGRYGFPRVFCTIDRKRRREGSRARRRRRGTRPVKDGARAYKGWVAAALRSDCRPS